MKPRFRYVAVAATIAAALHQGLLVHAQAGVTTAVNVVIDAIECLEPVSNGLLDHGDNVRVTWHAREVKPDGLAGEQRRGQSYVYGHSGDERVNIEAGRRTGEGGIWRGNVLPERVRNVGDPAELPMKLGQFHIADGQNAVLLFPVIWRIHGDRDDLQREWARHMESMRQWAGDVRDAITATDPIYSTARLRSRTFQLDWSLDFRCGTNPFVPGGTLCDGMDRPIGTARVFDLPDGAARFTPTVVVLNTTTVEALQQRNGKLRLEFNDAGATGRYALMLRVTVDSPSTQNPSGPNTSGAQRFTDDRAIVTAVRPFDLGRVWTVSENGWNGTWTRRGTEKVFDAKWTGPAGETATDEIRVESIVGDTIVLRRVGLKGTYTGRILDGGKRIEGTASWYPPNASFTATIR